MYHTLLGHETNVLCAQLTLHPDGPFSPYCLRNGRAMRYCDSLQSNEDMEGILKACSDAGVQFMDGKHCSAYSDPASMFPFLFSNSLYVHSLSNSGFTACSSICILQPGNDFKSCHYNSFTSST